MNFKIQTPIFEGPLDLLLSLIEKRKLFVNDISLRQVTDDYIEYIKRLESFPLADSAQFILIASTLLLIKSKSLLPNLVLTEEEQHDIKDLELRLKIYERIRAGSEHIKNMFGKTIIFQPSKTRKINPVFSPDESMNLSNIIETCKTLIKNLPKKEILPKAIVRKVISLEETIQNLTVRITQSLKMSFKEFTSVHKEERVSIIVSFLAVLELVKQGGMNVTQHETFGDIDMETTSVGVPKYF